MTNFGFRNETASGRSLKVADKVKLENPNMHEKRWFNRPTRFCEFHR